MLKNIFVGLVFGVGCVLSVGPAWADDDDNRRKWREWQVERGDWDEDDRRRGRPPWWDNRSTRWGGPIYAPPPYSVWPPPYPPPAYPYRFQPSWRPPVIEYLPPPPPYYHGGWYRGDGYRYYGHRRHGDDDDGDD